MKIIIDGFEIEVKAKKINSDRYNKGDTMMVLNKVSLLAFEASRTYEEERVYALADDSRTISETLYNMLKDQGMYDNI